MKRTSLGSSMKDNRILTRDLDGDDQSSKTKLLYLWSCNTTQPYYQEEDYLNGFSWPPRCYTCSFCKREFKSAQALGGHMNVHRRDRARLRLSPPLEGQQSVLEPNPNFNTFSPPSSTLSFSSAKLESSPNPLPSPISIPLLSLSSPSSSSATPREIKKCATFHMKGSDTMKTQKAKQVFGVQEDVVRLEKEIRFLGDSNEDLDLELRLGYSCF